MSNRFISVFVICFLVSGAVAMLPIKIESSAVGVAASADDSISEAEIVESRYPVLPIDRVNMGVVPDKRCYWKDAIAVPIIKDVGQTLPLSNEDIINVPFLGFLEQRLNKDVVYVPFLGFVKQQRTPGTVNDDSFDSSVENFYRGEYLQIYSLVQYFSRLLESENKKIVLLMLESAIFNANNNADMIGSGVLVCKHFLRRKIIFQIEFQEYSKLCSKNQLLSGVYDNCDQVIHLSGLSLKTAKSVLHQAVAFWASLDFVDRIFIYSNGETDEFKLELLKELRRINKSFMKKRECEVNKKTKTVDSFIACDYLNIVFKDMYYGSHGKR